ncbi:MAG: FAD-binding oxidoreductase [Parvibaculum sp.]
MKQDPLIERLREIVGEAGLITDPVEMAPYLEERRGLFQGHARALVKPASLAEVSAVMTLAYETNTHVVPQGGNTGLVGGQMPRAEDHAILLNLSRLNKVRAVDPANNTVSVDAGVTLAHLQSVAEEADRLFPLSLASEGTCQIGGNLSSNAGGTAVLRYGNARDLVLGIEIVLADGRIWDGMRALRKDNTGYDLKQLFLGSEGTLGIITGAVLKLFPRPRSKAVAFVAVPTPAAAVSLLRLVEAMSFGAVTSFELMPRIGIEMVTRHVPGTRDPLDTPHDWYVLIELSSGDEGDVLTERLEAILGDGLAQGLLLDATLARSDAQAKALWHVREAMSDAQRHEGGSIKHDISVPVSEIALFLERALTLVCAEMPGIRPVPFGHIGDGNIHFNLSQPVDMDEAGFLDQRSHFNELVHTIAVELGGSISAEHGIGQLKRDELKRRKSPVEIDLMRALKDALDRKGLLNPGKILKD